MLPISPSFAPWEPQLPPATGDTNLGMKWNFHKEVQGSRVPALGASLYIEFPTGDARQQLGSGLTDYWLNFIAQKSSRTRPGSTRILAICSPAIPAPACWAFKPRAAMFTPAGLSVLHDFTARLTLGGEIYGGFTNNGNLGRSQLQALVGGQYAIRNGLTFDFGLLGGKYIASPRIGGQIGFSVDFPDILRPPAPRRSPRSLSDSNGSVTIYFLSKGGAHGVQSGSAEKCSALCFAGRRRGRRVGEPGRAQDIRRARAHLQDRRPRRAGLRDGLGESPGHHRGRRPARSGRR